MLVLARRVGEAVVIGTEIEVRIVAIEGRRVRLAIAAPLTVGIRRAELGVHPAVETARADDAKLATV